MRRGADWKWQVETTDGTSVRPCYQHREQERLNKIRKKTRRSRTRAQHSALELSQPLCLALSISSPPSKVHPFSLSPLSCPSLSVFVCICNRVGSRDFGFFVFFRLCRAAFSYSLFLFRSSFRCDRFIAGVLLSFVGIFFWLHNSHITIFS